MSLVRAVQAESLKLRRTLALWMIVAAPAVVVALQFFVLLRFPHPQALKEDPWLGLASNSMNLWCAFMLPLFVTLETALLAGVEHGARAWKHLFALPVRRRDVYLAKLLVAFGCMAAAVAVLCMLIIAAGFSLRVLRPALGFGTTVPAGMMLSRAGLATAAAMAIVALQLWVAVRWASFTTAIGVGIAATFVTLFATGSSLSRVWLWTLPLNAVRVPERRALALAIGIVGGVVLGLAGAWDTARRDVA